MIQDLYFPVRGVVPQDHGYALFGALTGVVPILHGSTAVWAPLPLDGMQKRGNLLRLKGVMTLRVDDSLIDACKVLTGQCLDLRGHALMVGQGYEVRPLLPSSTLFSSFVTGKPREGGNRIPLDPGSLADMLARRLHVWDVDTSTVALEIGPLKTIQVQGHRIPGYPVTFTDLDDATSLRIQAEGIGGRRHFGAGIFRRTTS